MPNTLAKEDEYIGMVSYLMEHRVCLSSVSREAMNI
jgi:hypothetical protein